MKKYSFLSLLVAAFVLTVSSVSAQFTNKLESACLVGSSIMGNGTITFPASDYAICAFTTQIEVGGQWVNLAVNDKTPQSGKYSFAYVIPAGVAVSLPLKIRTVTNRQTASELVVNASSDILYFNNISGEVVAKGLTTAWSGPQNAVDNICVGDKIASASVNNLGTNGKFTMLLEVAPGMTLNLKSISFRAISTINNGGYGIKVNGQDYAGSSEILNPCPGRTLKGDKTMSLTGKVTIDVYYWNSGTSAANFGIDDFKIEGSMSGVASEAPTKTEWWFKSSGNQTILQSPNGNYKLIYQGDGNLVLYNKANAPIWATMTNGKVSTKLSFQVDGNIVMFNGSAVVWAPNCHDKGGAKLVLQDDGNLVVYTNNNAPIWATMTNGK